MHTASATSLVERRARRRPRAQCGAVLLGYDHANGWFSASARLHAALAVEPSDATIAGLVSDLVAIDARVLRPQDRLARLRLADRVSAWSQASSATALADYVGAESGDVHEELHLRLEVRIARDSSDAAAAADIASARALAEVARPVRDLWSSGQVTYRHVAAVLDRASGLDLEIAAKAVATIAPRLHRMPSTRVRGEMTRVISRLDPEASAIKARHERRYNVGVSFRSLPDGLGEVVATLPVEQARAVVERVDSAADAFLDHQRSCDECDHAVPAEIGPARAQAFLEAFGVRGRLCAAAPASAYDTPSTGRASRRRGELQVVVDLATLLGLRDDPGLLNGQPVPADIARELAGACGSLRRIVTDPVDGHLLDYGTRTYLPDPLKTFITARDGTCRSPGCGQPASRSQMDHVVPFPEGPSSTGNTHALCKRDHDAKTLGDLWFTSHQATGLAAWRTKHGQTGVTQPRPYLNDPRQDVAPF
ncbi:MAG TPA: hypothetical protein VFL59_06925 [Candidatus Nanopelagicales bacterium]|nr:hypothetical protein [Candidatus Nanopelagicales bacterium]